MKPFEEGIEEYKKRLRVQAIVRNIEASGIPERYQVLRFKDFNTNGEKKKEAILQECKDFINGKYRVGLIMVGKNGTGKTLLCSMIIHELIRKDPHDNYGYDSHKRIYTEAIKMIRTIKETWRKQTGEQSNQPSEQEAINYYVEPDILVIDEIGVQYGSATEAQFITEIINDRYNQTKSTILSGNVTVKEIRKLVGDRIIDRFHEDGKTLVFDWGSYRKKG